MAPGALLLLSLLGVIAAGCGGDDDDKPSVPKSLRPGGVVEYPAAGAEIRKPRHWTHRRSGKTLSLRSPDRTVILSISLSGTDRSAAALQEGLRAIRRQYRRVRVLGVDNKKVADLPTRTVVLSATNRRGVKLRMLMAAPQGRTRAWLMQVFSAEGAKERRLAEAQVVIGTLQLVG